MNISDRTRKIAPFYVMELLEKALDLEAGGLSVIHMEVGEPGFQTPSPVRDGAVRAISDGKTFYTHSLGLPDLREKIAEHYRDTANIDVPLERVIVTNGTSGAFILLFTALLEKGRVLALSDPGYPCHRNIALLTNCEIAPIPVSHNSRYEVTAAHLVRLGLQPDMIVVTNPSNPTGAVYRQETLFELYRHQSSAGGLLVVDEIYSGITYGVNFQTALSISDDIIVVNGFSKTYAMTGWRLGWMIIPSELTRPVQRLAQNLFISPSSLSQYAALRAFDNNNGVESRRLVYEEGRNFLIPRLRSLGFSVPIEPNGAFYIYAGIEGFGIDSMIFVERALLEAGVAITPGYDFGFFGAASHVRFSYANTLDNLKEGCDRLEGWLGALKNEK